MEIKKFSEYEKIDEKISFGSLIKKIGGNVKDVMKDYIKFEDDQVSLQDLADWLKGKKTIKQIFDEKEKIAEKE